MFQSLVSMLIELMFIQDGVSNSAIKLTTTVNIQINVRDAQDLPPIFTNLGSSATVNEAAPVVSCAFTERDRQTSLATVALFNFYAFDQGYSQDELKFYLFIFFFFKF